jgi:hypothetical protein
MLVLHDQERKEKKVMTIQQLETLSRIYNTLLLVNTKGEDTLTMADCLNAMRNFILTEKQNIENKEEQ